MYFFYFGCKNLDTMLMWGKVVDKDIEDRRILPSMPLWIQYLFVKYFLAVDNQSFSFDAKG